MYNLQGYTHIFKHWCYASLCRFNFETNFKYCDVDAVLSCLCAHTISKWNNAAETNKRDVVICNSIVIRWRRNVNNFPGDAESAGALCARYLSLYSTSITTLRCLQIMCLYILETNKMYNIYVHNQFPTPQRTFVFSVYTSIRRFSVCIALNAPCVHGGLCHLRIL